MRTRLRHLLARRHFAAGKELLYGTKARDRMFLGVDKLADAVEATLGPKGRNVIIEQSFGAPKITKDGVTVAKSIEFEDRYMNLGAQLVRQVAGKTADVAGDGTTTATVLARAIYSEGMKAVASGMNPMDLRRGIQAAVDAVVADVRKRTHPITSKEEIAQVATISANGDTALGKLIADAMEKVGKDGVISVQDGKAVHDELEVVEGMKFDRGYISPYFITNAKTQKAELNSPLILVYDGKVSSFQAILPLLEESQRSGRPLLIIAEDIEGEALASLIVNKLQIGLKVCAVKAPGFGDNRKAMMQDIAVLSGAQLISEEVGLKLEEVKPSMLGTAKTVTVTKDDTLILGGAGSQTDIQERCETIRSALTNTTSEWEKEKLQERLAKLSSGVAIIRVGGSSEVEVGEKKDRLDDALNATKHAVQEGIVPGGGTALLYASRALESLSFPNEHVNYGVNIVRRALRAPARAIAKNAGKEGDVVVGRLLEDAAGKDHKWSMGYNAQLDQYVDMIKAGIIDPTKVVVTALSDAASVASLMTTTEVAIVEAPKKKEANSVAADV